MIGFTEISRIVIPQDLFDYGHSLLREIGNADAEGLVLWAGRAGGDVFLVNAVLRPVQRSIQSQDGLCVLVEGPELHRIGVWLYRHQLQLVAQVHSHPTDAYHSHTDDTIPIATTEGALSLVVPNFARGDAQLDTYAAYRLDSTGAWCELSTAAVQGLIDIVAPLNA